MNQPIASRITAELEHIEQDIAAQKKIIKRNVGKQSVIDAAESELKALHTRQSILKQNRKKLGTATCRSGV